MENRGVTMMDSQMQQHQLQLQLETDDEPENNNNTNSQGRYRPPRPSAIPRRSLLNGPNAGGKSRRRSSARFLSIGGRNRNNPDDEMSHESLGKMYRQAIKMNAENRINASNSWNFKLIENIDKFLTEDTEEAPQRQPSMVSNTPSQPQPQQDGNRRVNFTKASCTLDASVKIYSYRVDDVHLTSYRVLENLHRSDGDKKKKTSQNDNYMDTRDCDEPAAEREKINTRSKSAVSTIESNLSNINLNKLDSAFDIDPLFHKMSKTFDEGGAKGLLLVNLGTSGDGCNIVFDSGIADVEEEKAEQAVSDSGGKMVDITSLTTKLEGLLSGQPIHSLPLVPQLAGLRAELSALDEEGFVDHNDVPVCRTRRFAPDPDEEKEADRSIHQDVLERSRASMGRSFVADDDELMKMDLDTQRPNNTEEEYAPDDFGGFDDDDDDGFEAFIAADDNGQRYSSLSFGETVPLASASASQTTVLLDAIASGQVLGESEYEFFDSQVLSHVAKNAWAGSAHWKPLAHLHKPRSIAKEPKTPSKKASRIKTSKERGFVDLTQEPDLADILRMPPKPRSKRAGDPLQFTSAGVTKYTKNENLLPPDAGICPKVLSSLFLRPNAVIKQQNTVSSNCENGKTVGFAMDQVETIGNDPWDDGSFGGGDDEDGGAGFAMSDSIGGNDEDEFVVDELEGVRKVDKVMVGYATIAKKVDVKRLKHDLWVEVDSHLKSEEKLDEEQEDFPSTPKCSGPLSFQRTVLAMEEAKSQVDVTLPFYFICILHLANEKGLRLDSKGLDDFEIHSGDGVGSFF